MILERSGTVFPTGVGVNRCRYKQLQSLTDGRNLNQEIVCAGLAWWYQQYAKHGRVVAALEAEARRAKRGLWSDPQPVPPWEWRKRGNGLVVQSIERCPNVR